MGRIGRAAYPYALVVEATFATAVLCASSAASDPYFIYLGAPALLAGLRGGVIPSFVVALVEILTIGVLVHEGTGRADLLEIAGPWVVTAFALGLLGAWIRELKTSSQRRSPYASAHRLLGQLRRVTRDLPGGLDIHAVAESILTATTEGLDGSRSALLLAGQEDLPSVVAHRGDEDFAKQVATDPIVGLSVSLQRVMQQPSPAASELDRYRTCLPLVIGGRCIGAVVVDGPHVVSPEQLVTIQERLDDDALRLESAVLFGDVRAMATVEERRRLAREIHDGIAQEIASLGYLVDELGRDDCDHSHQEGLVELRAELTRVVTELRLSIFDLRSGVSTNAGLGAVLGDYVREIGKNSGMTVHLSLEESPSRLRLDVETELLRVAQEAVNNARKHSRAANLWVTCRVEPPFAEIRVEDDGCGSATARPDHYGLHTMQERADRINAVLTVADRAGGGTAVSAVVLPQDIPTAPNPEIGETHVLQRASR